MQGASGMLHQNLIFFIFSAKPGYAPYYALESCPE